MHNTINDNFKSYYMIYCDSCLIIPYETSVITTAPGEECQGNAFWSVCPSVRPSVRPSVCLRNSKTIAPIDLIVLHRKYYTRGSAPSSKMILIGIGSGLKNIFKDSPQLGDRTKYAIKKSTPNVRCDENMRNVRHSERVSVISDCLVVSVYKVSPKIFYY